jgi:hypothetical protein
MIVLNEDGSEVMLIEIPATDEAQLQERLKNSPDLLPVDEFGLEGPLLVVGRETTLPSGAVDLLALAPSGDSIIIEMKTGPQNSDFRAAIAQAVDYGADLWQMTFEVFESTVAARYFAGPHCHPQFKGLTSVASAAEIAWPEMTTDQYAAFQQRLSSVLATGMFNFVVVAQRFTPSMLTTARYLNEINSGAARYFLVELVRFAGENLGAFEARTIVKPESKSAGAPLTNQTEFLESIHGTGYREALERLFETCHGLGMRFDWGSIGGSIRLPTPYRSEPVSIAWVFPPGATGWLGLRDVTFGYDFSQAEDAQGSRAALSRYVKTIQAIPGGVRVPRPQLDACSFSPQTFVETLDSTVEAIAEVVEIMNGSSSVE